MRSCGHLGKRAPIGRRLGPVRSRAVGSDTDLREQRFRVRSSEMTTAQFLLFSFLKSTPPIFWRASPVLAEQAGTGSVAESTAVYVAAVINVFERLWSQYSYCSHIRYTVFTSTHLTRSTVAADRLCAAYQALDQPKTSRKREDTNANLNFILVSSSILISFSSSSRSLEYTLGSIKIDNVSVVASSLDTSTSLSLLLSSPPAPKVHQTSASLHGTLVGDPLG